MPAKHNDASSLSWFYLEVITLENIFTWAKHHTGKKKLFRIHIPREKLQINKFKTSPTVVVVHSQCTILFASYFLCFIPWLRQEFLKIA